MVWPIARGYVMDFQKPEGSTRISLIVVVGNGIWVGDLTNQHSYSFDNQSVIKFVGPFVIVQYLNYWWLGTILSKYGLMVIGALFDGSHTLSRYNGFYNFIMVPLWNTHHILQQKTYFHFCEKLFATFKKRFKNCNKYANNHMMVNS